MTTYLIVDGYNVIHHWAEIRGITDINLENEREHLIHLLSDYSGYCGCTTLLVFDAYTQDDADNRVIERAGISVIFTGKDQTADSYIERRVYEIMGNSREARRRNRDQVRVVTSDNAVQQMVLACGAVRIPSRELLLDMKRVRKEAAKEQAVTEPKDRNRNSEHMKESVRDELEAMRRGK